LLKEAGVAFEIVDAAVEELTPETAPKLGPAELAEANALLKARAAAQPGRWTLGADTVVARDGRIFGKPATLDQAREFLRALSGGRHEVITGCVLVAPTAQEVVICVKSWVTFRDLVENLITRYLAAVPVLDKAGAYALQEHGDWLIESVDGLDSNVIGLPIERLLPVLRELGLAP
jgi:septum formation protein